MNAKKLKRFLSVVLSLSMVLSVNTVNFASEVTGIANPDAHVHEDAAGGHVHEWVLQETVTPATCLEDGVGVYACEGCEGTEEDAIPATKHSYEAEDFDKDLPENYEIVKEASCTEAGVKAYTCANEGCTEETGGHVEEEEIPAAGHTWENGECTVCHESQNVRELGDASNEELKSSGHQQADAPYEAPVVDFTDKEPAEQAEEPVKAPSMSNEVKQPEMFAAEEGDATTPTEPSTPAEGECTESAHFYDVDHFTDIPGNDKIAITRPATCTKNGLAKLFCTCGKSSKYMTIAMHHSYEKVIDNQKADDPSYKPTVRLEAGCVTGGLVTFTCTACNYSRNDVVQKTGHAYEQETIDPTKVQKGNEVEATCTEKGYTEYTCLNCPEGTKGKQGKVETGEPAGHNFPADGAEGNKWPATCMEAGRVGDLCSVCGAEKEGGTVTDDADAPRKGHSFEAKNEDGTLKQPDASKELEIAEGIDPDSSTVACGKGGVETYICEDCHEPYELNVDASHEVPPSQYQEFTIDATCTENAKKGTKCPVCKIVIEEPRDVVEIYKEAIESDPEFTGNAEEAAIAEAKEQGEYQKGHVWELLDEIKKATCTVDGYGRFKCTTCDITESRVIKAHHAFYDENEQLVADYSEDLIDKEKEPTCTENGKYNYICSTCRVSVEVAIEKIGHTWKDTEETTEKYPCNPGNIIEKCENCNEKRDSGRAATASAQHQVQDGIEATCTEAAKVGTFCPVCNDGKDDLIEEGNPLGHTYQKEDPDNQGTFILDETKGVSHEPTCVDAGYTLYTCEREGCGITHMEMGDEATGNHTYGERELIPPTCTSEAMVAATCSVCKQQENPVPAEEEYGFDDEEFHALGHVWKLQRYITEPTCTTEGRGVFECERCKLSDMPFSINAHHAYEKETIKGEEEKGGYVEDYSNVQHVRKEACGVTGLDIYTCTDCNTTKQEEIPALEHQFDYSKGQVVSQYACQDGKLVFTCTRSGCNGTDEQVYPATEPHKYVEKEIPATCTEAAKKGSYCSVCGELDDESGETSVGQPLGHAYESLLNGDGKIEVGKNDVDFDDNGKIVIPESDEYESTVHQAEDCTTANGTVDFTCNRCEEKATATVDIAAYSHEYANEHHVAATCQEAGKMVSTCTRCGDKHEESLAQYEPINPDAHNLKLKNENDTAKCGENAIYVCELCNQEITQKVEHAWGEAVWLEDNISKVRTCSKCNATEATEVKEGYAYCDACKKSVEPIVNGAKEATCSVKGSTGYQYCPDCGKTLAEPKEIGLRAHKYTWKVTKPATCAPGTEEEWCTYEGCSLQAARATREIPAIEGAPHNFVNGTCENGCNTPQVTLSTTLHKFQEGGNNKLLFTANIEIANKNLKVVSRGLLYYINKEAFNSPQTDLNALNPGVNVRMYEMQTAAESCTKTINLGTSASNASRTVYGRAYVIYEDENGQQQCFYSDVVQGSFNDAASRP